MQWKEKLNQKDKVGASVGRWSWFLKRGEMWMWIFYMSACLCNSNCFLCFLEKVTHTFQASVFPLVKHVCLAAVCEYQTSGNVNSMGGASIKSNILSRHSLPHDNYCILCKAWNLHEQPHFFRMFLGNRLFFQKTKEGVCFHVCGYKGKTRVITCEFLFWLLLLFCTMSPFSWTLWTRQTHKDRKWPLESGGPA